MPAWLPEALRLGEGAPANADPLEGVLLDATVPVPAEHAVIQSAKTTPVPSTVTLENLIRHLLDDSGSVVVVSARWRLSRSMRSSGTPHGRRVRSPNTAHSPRTPQRYEQDKQTENGTIHLTEAACQTRPRPGAITLFGFTAVNALPSVAAVSLLLLLTTLGVVIALAPRWQQQIAANTTALERPPS